MNFYPVHRWLMAAVAALAFTSVGAQAGNGASGGGKGVVCRDPQKKIRSAELLDLWEAGEIHGLHVKPAKGSVNQMVDRALRNLSQSMDLDLTAEFDSKLHTGADAVYEILSLEAEPFLNAPPPESSIKVKRLHGVTMPLTNDSFEVAVPENCPVEQIVTYVDYNLFSGTIVINQDIYDKLDDLNKAALIVHEALYKFLRNQFDESNSLRVRRSVGLTFSGHTFGTINSQNLPNEYYLCTVAGNPGPQSPNSYTEVYVFNVGNGLVSFQPTRIDGMPIIDSPTTLSDTQNPAGPIKDFGNLSELVNSINGIHGEIRGIVQPELNTDIRVDSTGPGGQLILSVGVEKSVFQPNGMDWQKATCKYVKGN